MPNGSLPAWLGCHPVRQHEDKSCDFNHLDDARAGGTGPLRLTKRGYPAVAARTHRLRPAGFDFADGRRQFGQRADDAVGLQRRDGHLAIAEIDGDDGHGRGARGAHIR